MRVLRRIEWGFQIESSEDCESQWQIEAEASVGYSEEAAVELEAKGRGDEYQQSDYCKKINYGEIPGRHPRGIPRKRLSCNFD